jgi:hypothetical protein
METLGSEIALSLFLARLNATISRTKARRAAVVASEERQEVQHEREYSRM